VSTTALSNRWKRIFRSQFEGLDGSVVAVTATVSRPNDGRDVLTTTGGRGKHTATVGVGVSTTGGVAVAVGVAVEVAVGVGVVGTPTPHVFVVAVASTPLLVN
jgi:hypothetical protein